MEIGFSARRFFLKRSLIYTVALPLIVAICCTAAIVLAKESAGSQKRAKPPKWTADVLEVFFPDARTKLIGTRPNYEHANSLAADGHDSDKSQPSTTKAAGGWS